MTPKNRFFIADFLQRLDYYFVQSPDILMRKLENYPNVDDLFMQLPPL